MKDYDLNLSKLTILFMLDNVNYPLTNSHISDFILKEGYTDYFKLQQYLNELVDSRLIIQYIEASTTYYQLADQGLATLKYFNHRLTNDTHLAVLDYLKKNRHQMREKSEIITHYNVTDDGDYIVHLVAKEQNKTLIDISMNVLTKEYALKAMDYFRNQSDDVYRLLLSTLIPAEDKIDSN